MVKNDESIDKVLNTVHSYNLRQDFVKNLIPKINEKGGFVEELLNREDKIIAYTSDGRTLNQTAYKADIDKAIEQGERREIVSIEEMEKELGVAKVVWTTRTGVSFNCYCDIIAEYSASKSKKVRKRKSTHCRSYTHRKSELLMSILNIIRLVYEALVEFNPPK